MTEKYFIYGVPGVGKTTIASAFSKKHGLLHIELDSVRYKTQEYVKIEQNPFIYEYTTAAWKKFGITLTENNAVQGFLAVRDAFRDYIQKELSLHGAGYIAEATFIDPKSLISPKSKVT